MEESQEKASPRSCIPGEGMDPSPFQWGTSLHLCPVELDGRGWGRCRKGHKGFSQELGLIPSRRKTAQRAGRVKMEEEEGEMLAPPRSCPC